MLAHNFLVREKKVGIGAPSLRQAILILFCPLPLPVAFPLGFSLLSREIFPISETVLLCSPYVVPHWGTEPS